MKRGVLIVSVGLGLLAAILTDDLIPQPHGSLVLWGFLAVLLSITGAVTWRRTGLPFMTGAMIVGSIVSVIRLVLAAMYGKIHVTDAPLVAYVTTLGLIAFVSLMLTELMRNKDKFDQCRDHALRASVGDFLTFRHIPRLVRNERDGAAD